MADETLLKTLYLIGLQRSKTIKPISIGELVKPCILTDAEKILSVKAAKKLEGIPLLIDLKISIFK